MSLLEDLIFEKWEICGLVKTVKDLLVWRVHLVDKFYVDIRIDMLLKIPSDLYPSVFICAVHNNLYGLFSTLSWNIILNIFIPFILYYFNEMSSNFL